MPRANHTPSGDWQDRLASSASWSRHWWSRAYCGSPKWSRHPSLWADSALMLSQVGCLVCRRALAHTWSELGFRLQCSGWPSLLRKLPSLSGQAKCTSVLDRSRHQASLLEPWSPSRIRPWLQLALHSFDSYMLGWRLMGCALGWALRLVCSI